MNGWPPERDLQEGDMTTNLQQKQHEGEVVDV